MIPDAKPIPPIRGAMRVTQLTQVATGGLNHMTASPTRPMPHINTGVVFWLKPNKGPCIKWRIALTNKRVAMMMEIVIGVRLVIVKRSSIPHVPSVLY